MKKKITIEWDEHLTGDINLLLPATATMTAELLGRGTPEQCVARTKELIDGLGGLEGGFVLSQDKMLTFKNDAKPENLKAVSEFVTNYRG